jgi:23S rRNA pseudouridine1911/1915/1917 synthase
MWEGDEGGERSDGLDELHEFDELDDPNHVSPGWLIVVDPEGGGERLDRLIARRVPRLSRARAARLEVSDLDDPTRTLKKSAKVRVGQRFWVSRPPPEEDLSALEEPTVLDETSAYIVLNKPPGWAAHPTASRFEATLTTWLKRRGTPAHPAHRLDVETSGVIFCAKERALELEVKALFKARGASKRYLAVCEGLTRRSLKGAVSLKVGDEWRADTPLGFDATSAVRLKMGRGELSALSLFEVLALDPKAGEGGRALISARPHTGRQHQLRAHLSLCGLPITGDKLYGPDEGLFLAHLNRPLSPDELSLLAHPRQALHAAELTLDLKDGAQTWRAPFPADLHALMSVQCLNKR